MHLTFNVLLRCPHKRASPGTWDCGTQQAKKSPLARATILEAM